MLILEGMTAGRNYCWLKNVGTTNKRPVPRGKAFTAPGKSLTTQKVIESGIEDKKEKE